MREKALQKKLDNISIPEKVRLTSPKAMRERKIVIKEFEKWMLCLNEYPHEDRLLPQYVLRAKDSRARTALYGPDFQEAMEYIDTVLYEKGKEYRVIRHARSEKSVPFREHRHVYPVEI